MLLFVLMNVATFLFIKNYQNLILQLTNNSIYHEPFSTEGFSKACFFDQGQKFDTKRLDNCLIQKTGKNILLFGDSHAAIFSRKLQELSSAININIMEIVGGVCPPIINSSKNYKKYNREFCSQNTSYLEQAIIHKKIHIDAVIMTAGWHTHQMGFSYEELEKTLDFFKANHIKVLFLEDVPEFRKSAISYAKFGNTKVSYDKITERSIKQNKEMRLFLNNQSNITTISLFDKICNSRNCTIAVGNKVLFIDAHHLSYEGTDYVMPDISKFMKSI